MSIQKEIVAQLVSRGELVTTELFSRIKDIIEVPGKSVGDYIKDLKNPANRSVSVVVSHQTGAMDYKLSNFVQHFIRRFKALEKMLRNRQELSGVTSMRRINVKGERESISLIGMVKEIREGKNNKIIVHLEDPTGVAIILFRKEEADLYKDALSLTLDEVIGVTGTVFKKNIVFGNSIIWPDIPRTNSVNKTDEEVFALFLSDIHVGSNMFLDESFEKFISWTKGEVGNKDQREIASKVKYIFICGDAVDGVGIYPGQDKELIIKDIKDQYSKLCTYLAMIPSHIQIIMSPGNHDVVRLEEPQPALCQKYAQSLHDLPNITLVSNPSYINIHSSSTNKGINVLLYHGYSYDYYISNIDELRTQGGYDRVDLTMKYLLKRRHLAPTHGSSLYIASDNDPLVIDKIPDIFVSGHVHKSIASNYRNVSLICGSCWQDRTPFQEKVGHNPEPCRVPLVNLKTRQIKILKFT